MARRKSYKRINENKTIMSGENFKQALLSIFIGCSVAFLASLMEGLADLLRANAENIVAGLSSTAVYLAKSYRA